MMCSRFLKPRDPATRHSFVHFLDGQFDIIRRFYERLLHGSLNTLAVTGVFALIILVSIYFLYAFSKKELAPQEDKGIIISLLTTAPNATLEQTRLFSQELYNTFASYKETDHVFQLDGINGINSSIAGMVMKPWDERTRTSVDLNPEIQMKLGGIAGGQAVSFLPSPLPGGGDGLPVQFVIGTTEPFDRLDEVARTFMDKARATGMFAYMDNNLKIDKPQTTLEFDRDKAAQLGLTMGDIGSSLGWMLGGGYVNYFSISGRSYKVIPQAMQQDRLNAVQLLDYKIRTAGGQMVPVATFTTLKTQAMPQSLDHFQQLNAATISAVTLPGVTLGQALDTLKKLAEEDLPQGYSADYAGQSRQYMQESSALVVTFFFALIIIFLALAAQFESFRDPLIIMVSVPMSICGAMIFISLGVGGASLNIYTQVGLVTLIGLISKNGILIVQFANDLQREGKSKREAVELAAGIRLRPILMTSAATVLGVLPLVIATGAGAAGRYNMGLVIATGISIGTLFTLFVVPAIYMLIATDHAKQQVRLEEGMETEEGMLGEKA